MYASDWAFIAHVHRNQFLPPPRQPQRWILQSTKAGRKKSSYHTSKSWTRECGNLNEIAAGGHDSHSLICPTDCVGRKIVDISPHATDAREHSRARVDKPIDPSKYSTRLIALKFAYLGQAYNGFEHAKHSSTPLPTIEEVLWKALSKARLIFPTPDPSISKGTPNWDGCEYSKCGRTDRGVSAFGQVVGLRVRSNEPVKRTSLPPVSAVEQGDHFVNAGSADDIKLSAQQAGHDLHIPAFHPIRDELPYCHILNRILPSDIRMLAWCPNPPDGFSARFSCRERRYEYFFTQPAFNPTPGNAGLAQGRGERREGWLDIEAMRKAAKKFEGLHDFRNLCKVDPSKQLDNFERRIFFSDVLPLDEQEGSANYVRESLFRQGSESEGHRDKTFPTSQAETSSDPLSTSSLPTVYVFRLHGSAFLWHQVRHMVSILFLVGQGFEQPSLIDELLDISRHPRKPRYEMAEDAPLVLQDCIFPQEGSESREDALHWVYAGDYDGQEAGIARVSGNAIHGAYGLGGVTTDMWKVWRSRKIDEILAGQMLNVVASQGVKGVQLSNEICVTHRGSQKVFYGGDSARLVGTYRPVLERPRMESVQSINEKYRKRKMQES